MLFEVSLIKKGVQMTSTVSQKTNTCQMVGNKTLVLLMNIIHYLSVGFLWCAVELCCPGRPLNFAQGNSVFLIVLSHNFAVELHH